MTRTLRAAVMASASPIIHLFLIKFMKKYIAEMVGTFVLTLLGCGAAVSLGCADSNSAAVVGTAIAFGLTVVGMAYAVGGVSGCHINPAITFGVLLSGRMGVKDAVAYWVSQLVGGVLAALVLYKAFAVGGVEGAEGANTCAYGVANGLIVETVLTFIFVLVVLGATSKTNGATNNFAGLAIGLTLTLVHLVGIHYTGTSVNPARSFGPALVKGGQALSEVWVFFVGPLLGAALAAGVWKAIETEK